MVTVSEQFSWGKCWRRGGTRPNKPDGLDGNLSCCSRVTSSLWERGQANARFILLRESDAKLSCLTESLWRAQVVLSCSVCVGLCVHERRLTLPVSAPSPPGWCHMFGCVSMCVFAALWSIPGQRMKSVPRSGAGWEEKGEKIPRETNKDTLFWADYGLPSSNPLISCLSCEQLITSLFIDYT